MAQMNLFAKQKQTHRHREQMWRCQGGGGEGEGWTGSLGLVEANLLHLEWVNHEFQMYRTGNYIQDPVINHNGREDKKRKECEHACTHICV